MTTGSISGSFEISIKPAQETVGGGPPSSVGLLVIADRPVSGLTSNDTFANTNIINSRSSTTRNATKTSITGAETVGIVGSTVTDRIPGSITFGRGTAIPESSTDMGVTIADMSFGFGLSLIFVAFIGGLVAV